MAFDIAVIDKETVVDVSRVNQLASTINMNDYNSIARFGVNVAEDVSKCADTLLQNDATEQIQRTQGLMTTVNKLMTNFDMKDLEPKEDKTFLDKITHKAENGLKKVVKKYDNLGKDIENVYVTIKSFTADIDRSNQCLIEEFKAQVIYYHKLKECIAACEMVRNQTDSTDTNAITLLEGKLNDLRSAEAVAVQSLMMLKLREFNNLNLSRKIDNAFIITLPLFKQKINEAIELKKTAIQAKALSMLDEKTNEMIKNNAVNAIETAKKVASMANSSSIKAETLEQTYQIIIDGVKEVQQIADNTLNEERTNGEKLKQIKAQFIENHNE